MQPASSTRIGVGEGLPFFWPRLWRRKPWGRAAEVFATFVRRAPMKIIIDQVIALLEDNDLDCLVLEEDVAVKTGMAGHHGQWTCNIEVMRLTESLHVLGALSRSTALVPPESRAPVLVLMNLINNYGAPVGNFQLDPSDGEVVFRTSIAFEDAEELAPELLAHTLYLNWAEIDRFLPAVTAVVEGEEPEDAFEALAAGED